MVGVLPAEEGGHHRVGGRELQNLCAQHHPRDQSSEQRHHQPDRDEAGSPRSYLLLHQPRHRRIGQPGQPGLFHQPVGQEIDQEQQREHGEEPQYGRASHVTAPGSSLGVHGSALDADENPHGHQHHVLDLGQRVAQRLTVDLGAAPPEVRGEQPGLEADGCDADERQDGHDLGDGHDDVDEGGGLNSAQRHRVHDPQQYRCADDRRKCCSALELRKEVAQRREQQDQIGDVADPRGHPVAECRCEADVVTEAGAGIAVDAAVDVGLALGQGLEDKRQHQHSEAGHNPPDQQWSGRCAARHLGGQREDAAADHRSHDDRGQRGQAESRLRGTRPSGSGCGEVGVGHCSASRASRGRSRRQRRGDPSAGRRFRLGRSPASPSVVGEAPERQGNKVPFPTASDGGGS